jgi:hypothetical protein
VSRGFAGAYYSRRERFWLRTKRLLCLLFGHRDRYTSWFGSWVPRCSRCLTFPVRDK